MHIKENIPLAPYTTFRIGGRARYFTIIGDGDVFDQLSEAADFAKTKNLPLFVLGGGSNLLISDQGIDALVIKFETLGPLKGISIRDDILETRAGENWDDVVAFAVENELGGIENLSLIPGSAGAAAVQNIGAYGSELSQSLFSLGAFDTENKKLVSFSNADCQFSYRMSFFKRPENKKFIITNITLRLSKNRPPDISYKDLAEYFVCSSGKNGLSGDQPNSFYRLPTIQEVRKAVIDIRLDKLPDPKKTPNAGSFFKNPIIEKSAADRLKKKYPDIPAHRISDDKYKVSAAWVIDHVCGLRGISHGNVGTHERQALVIVNRGGATGEEVKNLASMIAERVKEATGIILEREVEYI